MKKPIICLALVLMHNAMQGDIVNAPTNDDLFGGKTIVVLGGTGYLGRSVAAAVLRYNPHKLIIYSRDEVKHLQLKKNLPTASSVCHVFGDIRDYEHLLEVTRGADIVFHVAALKRADDLEENVREAVKTNIMGSLNVFNACVKNRVKRVVFISTDKACSPINAYGASKFVGEKIFTNYDPSRVETVFVATRFGNILQSTGSIIPLFTEKIKQGLPLTLTDERMTRFIIDKEEALEVIFDALRYGVGGEIFVKNLPSVRIKDLIEVLKKAYDCPTDITVTGLRPGEKLHEELMNRQEIERSYFFKNYYVITPSIQTLRNNRAIMPLYVRDGLRPSQLMQGLSSEFSLIDQDEMTTLFKKFGVL